MSLTEVLRLARSAPGATTMTMVWGLVSVGAALLIPTVSAQAIDDAVAGGTPGPALAVLAVLLALHVLAEACYGLARVSAAAEVAASLRYLLLRHVFALGVPGLRRHMTGDLVTRLTGNAARGASAVPTLVAVVTAALSSLGGLIALWLIDWRLGVAFVAGAIPAAILLRLLVSEMTSRWAEYLEKLGTIAARLVDALAGSRTIRASGSTRREIDRVLAPLPDLARAGMRTWEAQRVFSWQVELVFTGVRVAVLAVAGIGVAGGRISPGYFLAATLYLAFALGFLRQVDGLLVLAAARADGGRVFEVLAEEPQVPACSGRRAAVGVLPVGPGALGFRAVRVHQDGRVILDGLDLEVLPGAAVAVVGRSGAGKTTLAMLAGRLIEPDHGAVLIDGVRVDTLDPAMLRAAVGYAFDRPVLQGRTIREALRYGRPEASSADVEQAARIAQALDFIRRLPSGFDTPLAHAPFSGGELQRLGLARAIVHASRILVLDDATSSLDTATEARLAAALTEGLAGRTRLIMAHRAVTAARADLVAWLDGGRIRAVAPHRSLWAEPEYRAVFAAEGQPDEYAA